MKPEEVKKMLAKSLEGAIGNTTVEDERMFVAHSLEQLARMVKEGTVSGFDWKWQRGSGVIDAVNHVTPKHPLKFINLTINTGEKDANEESAEEV